MKKLASSCSAILMLIVCSMPLGVLAQGVNFDWARNLGGGGADYGKSVTTDASGNVYVTGFFSGTGDFDPGSATYNLTSAGNEDAYLVKFDNSGNFIWAKQFGGTDGDKGFSVAAGANGNVYITGSFRGTADLDPGTAVSNFTAAGSSDIFVCQLDAAGNLIWVRQLGGAWLDEPAGIAVDGIGNVYTTGLFQGQADFDPGTGVNTLQAFGFDAYVSKLDAQGNFVWAGKLGGNSSDFGTALSLDNNGNILITGFFTSTADFDPGAGTAQLTSAGGFDVFVAKLDSDGNYKWAKRIGGTGSDQGNSVTADANGNAYIAGTFDGTADFDPGSGTYNLTIFGGYTDAFVEKLDTAGNFLWAAQLGGTDNDLAMSIATDGAGNPVVAGYFNATADFDPSAASFNLTSGGVDDIFVCKLTANGNFKWAKDMSGTGNDYGFGVSVDNNGAVYTTGTFSGSVDFDPGSSSYTLSSDTGGHIFVQKMYCIDTNSSVQTVSACGSYTYNNIVYTTGGTHLHTFRNGSGCDSVVTLHLTINTIAAPVIAISGLVLSTTQSYASYQWFFNGAIISGATNGTYTVTQNGNYTVAVTDQNGCSDTSAVFTVTSVSVEDIIANSRPLVYPNPAHDYLYLQTNDPVAVIITGIDGKIVKRFTGEQRLYVGDLAAGTYFVRLTDMQGRFHRTEKIVKTANMP